MGQWFYGFQDGNRFYGWLEKDGLNSGRDPDYEAEAPFKVKDFDMEAADVAKTWLGQNLAKTGDVFIFVDPFGGQE